MNRVILLAILGLAWAVWSGMAMPLLIGLGVASCVLVVLLSRRMDLLAEGEFALHLGLRILPFWGWMLGQMIRSSFQVARIVLDPRLPISPTRIELDTGDVGPVSRVILGNSITLTPGTLTIDMDGRLLHVHCLTRDNGDELLRGEMARRVAAVTRD